MTKKKTKAWTLEDAAHFIIYRELNKLRVPLPYEKAERICEELKSAVEFRTRKR